MNKKPVCKLIGTDGNVFSLAGRVVSSLKREGLFEEAKEFSSRLLSCKSYAEALEMMSRYVEIK